MMRRDNETDIGKLLNELQTSARSNNRKQEFEEKQNQFQDLQNMLEELRSQLSSVKVQIEVARADFQTGKSDIGRFNEVVRPLRSEEEELSGKLNSLQSQLNLLKIDLARLGEFRLKFERWLAKFSNTVHLFSLVKFEEPNLDYNDEYLVLPSEINFWPKQLTCWPLKEDTVLGRAILGKNLGEICEFKLKGHSSVKLKIASIMAASGSLLDDIIENSTGEGILYFLDERYRHSPTPFVSDLGHDPARRKNDP